MNSPDVLLRLVQADTPPSLVFSWVRFSTAPLRGIVADQLVTAIIISSENRILGALNQSHFSGRQVVFRS